MLVETRPARRKNDVCLGNEYSFDSSMTPQRLGQHFLIDTSVVKMIVDAADMRHDDIVVEVGPGRGALTKDIVSQAGKVLLIEYDAEMAARLALRYETDSNVKVLNLDARHFGSDSHAWLSDGNYKVVANLPYYAANPIVRNFLESTHQPTTMVIMVQREVANDMAAEPGDMSLLSLAVQIYASVDNVIDVPPECFDPPPKVHSSVLKLKPVGVPRLRFDSSEDFFKLARGGFKSPRKQLHNSLADGLFINLDDARKLVNETGIETTRRPATLSIDDWQVLYDVWVANGRPSNTPGSVRRSDRRNLNE